MRGKLMLVAGLAVGYVLGSRAGRERYNQIARAADSFWHSRPVQRQMHQAGDLAREKAPDVVDFVSDNVKRAMRKSQAKKRAARSRRSSSNGVSPQPASN